MTDTKKACVIGAGIAGLVTARTLKAFGWDVTIYDKEAEIGGVWTKSRQYPGCHNQNSTALYRFSDLPFPPSVGALASREDSQRYLQAYIDKHDLRITHSAVVNKAHYSPTDKTWEITVSQNGLPDGIEIFDALFVCTGIFSEPFVPNFNGRDHFEAAGGQILHSTKVGENVDFCKGKDVVVLGFGRSSCDIAAALAREGTCRSITLVCRQTRWKWPQYICGRPFDTVVDNRLMSYLDSLKANWWDPLLLLRWILYYLLELYIRWTMPLVETGTLPKHSFRSRLANSVQSDGFLEAVQAKKIRLIIGTEVSKLTAESPIHAVDEKPHLVPAVHLATGERLLCDILICGTGFKKTHIPFLSEYTDQLQDKQGAMLLHHNILPLPSNNTPSAKFDKLYFVGYKNSNITCLWSELGALWAVAHLERQLRGLPDAVHLRTRVEVLAQQDHLDRADRSRPPTLTGSVGLEFFDRLCAEMGVQISWSAWLKQRMGYVDPQAYVDVIRQVNVTHPQRQ